MCQGALPQLHLALREPSSSELKWSRMPRHPLDLHVGEVTRGIPWFSMSTEIIGRLLIEIIASRTRTYNQGDKSQHARWNLEELSSVRDLTALPALLQTQAPFPRSAFQCAPTPAWSQFTSYPRRLLTGKSVKTESKILASLPHPTALSASAALFQVLWCIKEILCKVLHQCSCETSPQPYALPPGWPSQAHPL